MRKNEDSLFVSRETQERLRTYADLVLKWQKSINLIAPNTIPELWERHIRDSVQLYNLTPEPRVWADLGSGGGFPGMVTAICLAEAKDGWVHLIESNNKKASFLRSAIGATGARASVHPVRIEAAVADLPAPDAISARALAQLGVLLDYAAPWIAAKPGIECWFHKGFGYREELDQARGQWQFDLIEHPSSVQDGSVILHLKSIQNRKS